MDTQVSVFLRGREHVEREGVPGHDGRQVLRLGGQLMTAVTIFGSRQQIAKLIADLAALLTVDEALDLLHSMTAEVDDELTEAVTA